MWTRFNRREPNRPMALVFPEGSCREILPEESLACTEPACRDWERDLRRRICYWEELRDDNVVDAAVASPIVHALGDVLARTKRDLL